MTDFFLQIGLSNACFSLALAILAMVVGAKARRPHLAYLLWLLVFVKLLTPPLVTIPVVTIPWQSETSVAINDPSQPGSPIANGREPDVDGQPGAFLSGGIGSVLFEHGKTGLKLIWLVGSLFVFGWSLVRIFRFNRLLKMQSEVAPQHLQTVAVRIASRLGLKAVPAIDTTSANLSPMVWWIGGKVRIIIPTALIDQMDTRQFQWIIAHELAHVRRRDYLVRWIEWLACVCFWWNPVTWWARHNLRANEEICCDALVVSSLNPTPNSYANSLLMAIEFLACPAIRPPAIASEINSGGFLERRFKMIVSETPKRSNSRWLRACVLLCAVIVLPFGMAFAQDYDAVGKRLRAAVRAGELTGEQARAMLGTLRKADGTKKDTDYKAIGKKIRAAVVAGEITAEEGRAKMEAIKKKDAEKRGDGDRTRAYLMKVRKELGEAIKAGKISEEDAKKRYAAAEKAIKKRTARARGDRGERRITVEEYRRAEARMRKMIEEGKAQPEDVERRLIEMRKIMGAQGERKREARDIDWDGIKRRIEGAVKSGKMTREEADAKYKEIRKRIGQERGRQRESNARGRGNSRNPEAVYKAAEKEVKAGIAAGKITEAQGKERLAGLRKRLAEGARGERTRGKRTRGESSRGR